MVCEVVNLRQYHPRDFPFDPHGHKYELAIMYFINLPSWLLLPRQCDGDYLVFISLVCITLT
jgi:hypothetical protein